MRHEALALFEQGIKTRYGFDVVVGIDEAGRGSLAGPVTAGACAITDPRDTAFINDSKLLSPRQRQQALAALPAHAVFTTASASAAEVDELGIVGATFRAMERALKLEMPCVYARWGPNIRVGVVVDGSLFPPFLAGNNAVTAVAIVDADACVLSVAGASIAAKVVRDGFMRELGRRIRGYGFETNAGYGTRRHIEALRTKGPSSEHRRTFVVKELLQEEALPFETQCQSESRKRR